MIFLRRCRLFHASHYQLTPPFHCYTSPPGAFAFVIAALPAAALMPPYSPALDIDIILIAAAITAAILR